MNLQGSAVYLRQQMTDKLAARPSLQDDTGWLQTYALCMIAAELETIRVTLQRDAAAPLPPPLA